MQHFVRGLGSLMMAIGVGLLVATTGLYFYLAEVRDRDAAVVGTAVSSQFVSVLPSPAAPQTWRPDRIQIPKLDLDASVVEAIYDNSTWKVPDLAVGHLEGTAYPGSNGNVVFTGHLNDVAGDRVFGRLKEVEVGDSIILSGDNKMLTYTVAEVKAVEKDDLSVLMPSFNATLTLITCAGSFDPLALEYRERLIVIAHPSQQ